MKSYLFTGQTQWLSTSCCPDRLREIAKPCLNVREWRIFFPFDDESTAKQKVDECEARASGAPAP